MVHCRLRCCQPIEKGEEKATNKKNGTGDIGLLLCALPGGGVRIRLPLSGDGDESGSARAGHVRLWFRLSKGQMLAFICSAYLRVRL